MGDLADNIITELRQKFDRHPVRVWYDAQENYKRENSVHFEVIDTDTRETITRKPVELDLLFGDDDMGLDV